MEILVFKTDIEERFELDIKNLLYFYFIKNIYRIDFDFEDCDHILRLETNSDIISEIEALLSSKGFLCKAL